LAPVSPAHCQHLPADCVRHLKVEETNMG
jgi:hypothetical protein